MHEDLLGYLLGALEPHEMERVSNWLQSDPDARKQLAEIERALQALEDDSATVVEPVSGDLVARTMANIPPLEWETGQLSRLRDTSMASLVPLHPEYESVAPSQSSWLDWCGGAVAVAIMLGLLMPSIAAGRLEARKAACQDRLRQLGTAITQFVNRDHQHRLPAVSESGPEAFAGVYAVRLHDAGLLPDADIRWCPSLPMPELNSESLKRSTDARVRSVTMTPFDPVPSVDDLYEATVNRLRQIQQIAGGHYAYTLGVLDQYERLKSPRFEARASFAVMSDAPPAGFPQRQDIRHFTGHGGEGINVMFEDGRINFIRIPTLNALPDHPLLNNRGLTEAGVHMDDASLAPSWVAPFINAVQR